MTRQASVATARRGVGFFGPWDHFFRRDGHDIPPFSVWENDEVWEQSQK